uniref:holo-[acyl-carrier-protein] synthase n=1 Tax=Chaetoceros debilis TaxID=122233 RepID=A0A7S3V7K0_9STRA
MQASQVSINCLLIDLTEAGELPPEATAMERAKQEFEALVRKTFGRSSISNASTPILDIARSTSSDAESAQPKTRNGNGFKACIRKLTGSRGRTSSLSSSPLSENKQKDDAIKSILRFIKVNDQYIALTSILLKSYLYYSARPIDPDVILNEHACEDNSVDKDEEPISKPIITLPRTKYGKPYIPKTATMANITSETNGEESLLPFSLSHHYPFVGLAYINGNAHEKHLSLVLGFDIVTFNSFSKTRSLYSSTEEYLQPFKSCFTDWEWEQINYSSAQDVEHNVDNDDDDHPKVKEMLLRWAMKEAYTKGLGTGLGTDFGSFAIRLQGIDNGEGSLKIPRVWDNICEAGEKLQITASIFHKDELNAKYWEFIFIPLTNKSGCACICIEGRNRPKLKLSAMSIQHLLEYHS